MLLTGCFALHFSQYNYWPYDIIIEFQQNFVRLLKIGMKSSLVNRETKRIMAGLFNNNNYYNYNNNTNF